jgi:hypothetical protein
MKVVYMSCTAGEDKINVCTGQASRTTFKVYQETRKGRQRYMMGRGKPHIKTEGEEEAKAEQHSNT